MAESAEATQDTLHIVEDENIESKSIKLKCYETRLIDVYEKTVEELFSGFDTIKARTFSYEIGFMDKILENFKYSEIILGAQFMYEKDEKLKKQLIQHLVNTTEVSNIVREHASWVDKIQEGSLILRCSLFLDHSKVYLLQSDTGRTRVIVGSANCTGNAWNGNQIEQYTFDDSIKAYDYYSQDFETSWANAIDVPYEVVSCKKSDNIIENNLILKKLKETDTAVVLQQICEPDIEFTKYVMDHKAINEEWAAIVGDMEPSVKNGAIELIPKNLIKLTNNLKRITRQKEVKLTEKPHPKLTYNLTAKAAYLDGQEIDLKPAPEEVERDIFTLLEVFNNFNDFVVDNPEKFKLQHFKLLNYMFASPFIANLRLSLCIHNIGTYSLPLFLLVSSKNANSGKSFMVELILKMMTGLPLKGESMKVCRPSDVEKLMLVYKGVPVFIDEIDNRYFSLMKNTIKNAQDCELHGRKEQPLFVFASNNVVDPDETIRKRLVYINLNAGLPSDIDQNAYINKGKSITARIGTAFYREYFRQMLDAIGELEDFIDQQKNSEDWYPDITAISSEIIIRILQDNNIALPSYFRKLSWNDDYYGAKYIAEDTLEEIKQLYLQNSQAFKITRTCITIEMGNDGDTNTLLKSWEHTLPAEINAKAHPGKESIRLVMKRKELEKFLHISFNKSWISRFWRK